MRIVAGEWRSRRIETRDSNETRPTLDKVREAVFSALGGMFSGGVVLDLYAGSGAVGLEALSRGMDHAILSDISRDAYNVIQKNVASLQCQDRTEVYCMRDMKVLALLKEKQIKMQLVYLDPPYAKQHNQEVLEYLSEHQMMNEGGMAVVESDKQDHDVQDHGRLKYISDRIYGITRITYYKYEG